MSKADPSLKDSIIAALSLHDWVALDRYSTAIAYKDYRTAVGTKRADVYLTSVRDESCAWVLRADYQSEGRNILSTIWCPLPAAPSEEFLSFVLNRFNAEINELVDESYARRLVLNVAQGER